MTPTALERIKEIEKDGMANIPGEDMRLLLKAFNVMREMLIKQSNDSWHRGDLEVIDREFEKRMSK